MAGSPLVLLKSIKDSMGHLEKGDRFFMNGPMIFPVRSHNGNTCPYGQEQRSHHVCFFPYGAMFLAFLQWWHRNPQKLIHGFQPKPCSSIWDHRKRSEATRYIVSFVCPILYPLNVAIFVLFRLLLALSAEVYQYCIISHDIPTISQYYPKQYLRLDIMGSL